MLARREAHAQPAAQPAALTPEQRAASARYDEGVRRFDRGEFEPALREFLAAYELVRVPSLLYNIGVAQRRLGDIDSAIGSFERYVATAGEQIPPERRSELEQALAEMRGSAVEVQFVIEAPPGVRPELYLDQRPLGAGPWDSASRAYRVTPEEHEVRARAAGLLDAVERVRLVRGPRVTVRLRMTPARTTGVLRVGLAARVAGARARVDRGPLVDLPIEQEIEQGDHVVRVTAPQHHRLVRRVRVEAGERAVLELALRPIRPPPSPPVYAQWWFWAGAGAVLAAGGAVLSFVLATTVVVRDADRGATVCLESRVCR